MKKSIIAVSSFVIVALFAIVMLLGGTKDAYEVGFEKKITVENGVTPETMMYTIVLPEDGKYVIRGEWKIQPLGMLLGYNIEDEKGNFIDGFVAGEVFWNSDVRELPAGTYTMTLTPIASVEQFRAYFSQYDASDRPVPVEELEPGIEFRDGEFQFEFAFELKKVGNLPGTLCVMGAVIGVALSVILYAIAQKDDSMKQNYDERQELNRGRGAKCGIYTMFFLDMILFLMETAGISLPVSAGLALFINTLVGGCVYAVYCVWREAYYALNQRENVFTFFILVIGIINLLIGIKAFTDGVAIQDNQLTLRSINLFAGIMMVIICGTLILKKVFKERGED